MIKNRCSLCDKTQLESYDSWSLYCFIWDKIILHTDAKKQTCKYFSNDMAHLFE